MGTTATYVFILAGHTENMDLPSYTELAEEAESITAEFGEQALMARYDEDVQDMESDAKVLLEFVPSATGECALCHKLLGTGVFYDYRTPFMLSDKPELLEAALTLLKEAESESIRPIDGSIRASTVR